VLADLEVGHAPLLPRRRRHRRRGESGGRGRGPTGEEDGNGFAATDAERQQGIGVVVVFAGRPIVYHQGPFNQQSRILAQRFM